MAFKDYSLQDVAKFSLTFIRNRKIPRLFQVSPQRNQTFPGLWGFSDLLQPWYPLNKELSPISAILAVFLVRKYCIKKLIGTIQNVITWIESANQNWRKSPSGSFKRLVIKGNKNNSKVNWRPIVTTNKNHQLVRAIK